MVLVIAIGIVIVRLPTHSRRFFSLSGVLHGSYNFNQLKVMKVYKIVHDPGGWCVAYFAGLYENGESRWHRVSNLYMYRGWAQAFSRRMGIKVINYESRYK